jgi:hypothetical protein
MNDIPATCPICGKPIIKCFKFKPDCKFPINTVFCSKACFKENAKKLNEKYELYKN